MQSKLMYICVIHVIPNPADFQDFFSYGLEKDVNEIRDIVEIYFYFYPFSNLTVHFLTEIKIHTMNKIKFYTKEVTNIFKG